MTDREHARLCLESCGGLTDPYLLTYVGEIDDALFPVATHGDRATGWRWWIDLGGEG